jgi:hypothetical protein
VAGKTPLTKPVEASSPNSVQTNNYAASVATAASAAVSMSAAGYEALGIDLAALAADIAVSGFPVNIWRETITRHIPEKNTWEVSVELQTDYEADIEYEPEGWEAKIKGSGYYSPEVTISSNEEPKITGVASISPQTAGSVPTTLISHTKPAATEESMTRHPAPPENTYSMEDINAPLRPSRSQTRATIVENNAHITAGPAAPTDKDGRDYLWAPDLATVSSQNQEVYFGVSDDAGHDIIKASVGVEPKPVVSIHGATRQLSVGGAPVTFKGHTFSLAPAGLKVGSTTLSMQAIAPAFPTDFQAVLTIDEAPVTFMKEANNPTIMTAGRATVTLDGPPLITKGHEIVYNTMGALVMDGTISVDPSPVRISGRPVPQPSPVAPAPAAGPIRGPIASAVGQQDYSPIGDSSGSSSGSGSAARPPPIGTGSGGSSSGSGQRGSPQVGHGLYDGSPNGGSGQGSQGGNANSPMKNNSQPYSPGSGSGSNPDTAQSNGIVFQTKPGSPPNTVSGGTMGVPRASASAEGLQTTSVAAADTTIPREGRLTVVLVSMATFFSTLFFF